MSWVIQYWANESDQSQGDEGFYSQTVVVDRDNLLSWKVSADWLGDMALPRVAL